MKLHQHVCMSLQQFNKGYFGKITIAAVLGLVLLVTTFGLHPATTHAAAYTPTQTNDASIENTINSVFGAYAPAAKRIAMCESTMNPNATNTMAIGNSHAAGLFQILYPSTWYTTSQASQSPYNATANTIAAHDIFVRDGYSWREWQCQP